MRWDLIVVLTCVSLIVSDTELLSVCLLSLALTLASALTGGGRCGALSGSPAQREGDTEHSRAESKDPGTQMPRLPSQSPLH